MYEADAIADLVESVIDTFRTLRVIGAKLHRHGAPMTGERGILMELSRNGPRTVPDIARKVATSRQHVQVIVDRFMAEGLVRRTANPAHRRSVLIALTAAGKREVNDTLEREARLFAAAVPALEMRRVRNAAATLRDLREALQSAVAEGRGV